MVRVWQLLEPASNSSCLELRQAQTLTNMQSLQVQPRPKVQALLYSMVQEAPASKLRIRRWVPMWIDENIK